MSLVGMIWCVSVAGALAFWASGFLLGRGMGRRAAALVLSGPPSLAGDPLVAVGPPMARSEVPQKRSIPTESELLLSDSGYREERLSALLGALDPEGAMRAVLADSRGLPMASWGMDIDAEATAAVGANAATLATRTQEFGHGEVNRVEMRLGNDDILQVRIVSRVGAKMPSYLIVCVGPAVPTDERFKAIQGRILQLLEGQND